MSKFIFTYCIVILFLFSPLYFTVAQDEDDFEIENDLDDILFDIQDPLNFRNIFGGNFGWINIGGDDHIGLRLQPEFAIGKLGIGMDIPLYYNIDQKEFRNELYKDNVLSAIFRTVRYIRFGRKKRDKVYVKAGDLTGAYIGYGLLLNNYSNTYSEEKRKIGIELDILFNDLVGIEALYSDVVSSSFNLLAIRPYVRPFARMDIPIMETIEIGGTFITDKDETENFYPEFITYNNFLSDGITAFGFDLGVTLVRSSFLNLLVFSQYGQINDNDRILYFINYYCPYGRCARPDDNDYVDDATGTAISIGAMGKFRFIADIFSMGVKIDRIWYSNNFIPQFFDTSYEINKDTRIISLTFAEKQSGIYGSISGHIMNNIIINGTLLLPDKISETNPAALKITATVEDLINKITIRGSYYKGNLPKLDDAFKIDNAVANLRLEYKFNKFLVAGIDYYRTFARNSDGHFTSTDQTMPYVGIRVPLGNNYTKEEDY